MMMTMIDRIPTRFFETRAALIAYRVARLFDRHESGIAAEIRDAIRDNSDLLD
jgi:hypothetical protein